MPANVYANDITSMIATLPTPTELQFSFPKEWSEVAMGAFGGSGDGLLGTAGDIASYKSWEAFFGSIFGGIFGLKQNKALNKNERVLFQTLKFRTIQLAWELIPKNPEEARAIEEFIKKMKALSAPYDPHGGGTWNFPDTFKLEIKSRVGNYVAFRTPEMACTDLTVNHTPQGFMASHTDGYPVKTTLSMSFMERELAVREKIESGEII